MVDRIIVRQQYISVDMAQLQKSELKDVMAGSHH